LLDACESLVHGLPAARDEIDEQCEVVDARVPFRKQFSFEMLEPSQDLVHHPADLREVARTRAELLAKSVLDRLRQACLQLRRRPRERLDRGARAAQRRFDVCGCGPRVGRRRQTLGGS
jgi:hypothetical protein